jgi:hypothetical protein
MKFIDLEGNQHSREIDYKKHKRTELSRSKVANLLYKKICEIFPNLEVLEEFPCVGLNPVLYVDFLILSPGVRIAFECDGVQHRKYVPFFHGSRANYARSKVNDISKERWLDINGIRIIRIENEQDVENLLDKINE